MQGDTALHYAYRSLSTDVIEFLELHVQGIKDIRNDVSLTMKVLALTLWVPSANG